MPTWDHFETLNNTFIHTYILSNPYSLETFENFPQMNIHVTFILKLGNHLKKEINSFHLLSQILDVLYHLCFPNIYLLFIFFNYDI